MERVRLRYGTPHRDFYPSQVLEKAPLTPDIASDRDLLVRRLSEDLVGPRVDEEILSDRPTDTYLTGILWPQRTAMRGEDDDSLAAGPGGDDGSEESAAAAGPAPAGQETAGAGGGVGGGGGGRQLRAGPGLIRRQLPSSAPLGAIGHSTTLWKTAERVLLQITPAPQCLRLLLTWNSPNMATRVHRPMMRLGTAEAPPLPNRKLRYAGGAYRSA